MRYKPSQRPYAIYELPRGDDTEEINIENLSHKPGHLLGRYDYG